jgi:hypothetical protein
MNISCITVFLFIFVRMCNWLILDDISLFVVVLGNVPCSANRLKRGDSGAYAKALLIHHKAAACFPSLLSNHLTIDTSSAPNYLYS